MCVYEFHCICFMRLRIKLKPGSLNLHACVYDIRVCLCVEWEWLHVHDVYMYVDCVYDICAFMCGIGVIHVHVCICM